MRRRNKAGFGGLAVIILILAAAQGIAAETKYDAGGRRDPFIPLEGGDAAGGKAASAFTLEGIIYDPPQKSMALIGGLPCKVGDAVGDGKVLEIHKDSVVIQIDSERKTLRLREDDPPQKNDGDAKTS